MNYLKLLKKTIIQKVEHIVQDQYIQPITQQQIYTIINHKSSKHKKYVNHHSPYNNSLSNNNSPYNNNYYSIYQNGQTIQNKQQQQQQQYQQILSNIDRISLITPQRQFKLIGQQYSFQQLNHRIKQLKSKLQLIKSFMIHNYHLNLLSIENSIAVLHDVTNINITKNKSLKLKSKINLLIKINQKTKNITKLNIKIKNIKNTIKILQKIPNIHKMNIFELKNINIEQLSLFNHQIIQKNNKNMNNNNINTNNSCSIQNQSNALESCNSPDCSTLSLICLSHIPYFIQHQSFVHFSSLTKQLTQCFLDRFSSFKYQKQQTHEYQKLLIRLLQTQIRNKQKQFHKNKLYQICKEYLNIVINLSKIIRWHWYNKSIKQINNNNNNNNNQEQQRIRFRSSSLLSQTSQQILSCQSSIRIQPLQLAHHIYSLMDLCLKQQIQQIFFNDIITYQEIYQNLVTLNRFYQLVYSFSSYLFIESKQQIREIMIRKSYKLLEKGIKQFNEALLIEERNQWNRLPVAKNYRHKNIQITIQTINKLIQLDNTSLSYHNYQHLNLVSDNNIQLLISISSGQLKQKQQQQQSFQFDFYKYPSLKLFKSFSEQLQIMLPYYNEYDEVIICQSSQVVLNYYQHYMKIYLYSVIKQVRKDILQKMIIFAQYYFYYIFQTFLSSAYKRFFLQQMQFVDDKYFQQRIKKNYRHLYQLINRIYIYKNNKQYNQQYNNHQYQYNHNNHNNHQHNNHQYNNQYIFMKKQIKQSRVSIENSLKARVIAVQSIRFTISYLEYILQKLLLLTKYNINKNSFIFSSLQQQSTLIQKYISQCYVLFQTQTQLMDLFLTDQVSKTIKNDFIDPIFKRIKWYQLDNTKQITDYSIVILKHIKQVYDKIRSNSKGEITIKMVDKIFAVYWKTQLIYMTKIFLNQHITNKHKGGKQAKFNYQLFIDILYQGVIQFLDEKHKSTSSTSIQSIKSLPSSSFQSFQSSPNSLKSTYIKIKNIFSILLQTQWQKCYQMICLSMKNHQFTYKITLSIMMASESSVGINNQQAEQRQQLINQYINKNIFKQSSKLQ